MSEEEDAAAILNGCNVLRAQLKDIKDGIDAMSATEKSDCRQAMDVSAAAVLAAKQAGGIP